MLVESRYNLIYNNQDFNIVVNTLEKTSTKIISKNNNLFEVLKNPNDSKYDFITKKLITKGILIENNKNEKEICTYKVNKSIYSSKELNFMISLGKKCNFRCKYCWQDNNINEDIKKEDLDNLLKYLKKKLKNNNSLIIEWFGGEPLIYKDIIKEYSKKFINVCKNYNLPYMASITTNGYLLDEDTIKDFLKARIFNYQITLDGIESIHNLQRPLINGEATYKKILSNLELLDKMLPRYSKVFIRINLTKQLFNKKYEVLYNLKKINFSEKFIFRLENCKITSNNTRELSNDEFIEFCSVIKQNELPIIFNFSNIKNSNFCSFIYDSTFMIEKNCILRKCLSIHNIGSIDYNGNIRTDEEILSKFYNFNLINKCENCKILPICYNLICPYDKSTCYGDILLNNNFGNIIDFDDTIII